MPVRAAPPKTERTGSAAGGAADTRAPTLLAGTANPALARAVAARLGAPLAACVVERFPDGEVAVQLGETVRGREVVLVQPTAPPVNDHLMELLALADACRRDSAARVTAAVPYFGYARSDRRDCRREPIMASLVAEMLQCAGVAHVVLVDVHTPQIEGFFRVPVDNLTAVPTLCAALREALPADAVVVSPDAGRVKMATEYARCLDAPLAVINKRRRSATETESVHLMGDVRGRRCVLIDDMISTGGTIASAARTLRDAGAHPELTVAATHALLLDDACARMARAGVRHLVTTDSVRVDPAAHPAVDVRVVSIAPLLAAAIARQLAGESLAELFVRAPGA